MRSSATLTRLLPILTLLLALVALPAPPDRARANTTYQPLPFSQDWTNAGLITSDDDWSGVPGIIGYRGDGLTGGTNPQTVLADGSGTPVDVNANESNPDTFDTGGLAEFDTLANPTIALQGSGTSDAPHLVIALDTTGFQNINVQYTVRDIDGSADNETQPVALHYRVGGSGNYTNIPGAYIVDATTGPNEATRTTTVNIVLPAAANNQPQLQLRIMTINAPQVDEWVGIDDLSVTGVPLGEGDPAPVVEGSVPTPGGTLTANKNIVLTFSEPVTVGAGAATIDCGGTIVEYAGLPVGAPGASEVVLDPLNDLPLGSSCQLTLDKDLVTDVDGTPTSLQLDYQLSFTVAGGCPASTLTLISAVQGSGDATPLPATDVTVRGVVTAVFEEFQGFYMQEEIADQDTDPATSEGIFIFAGAGGYPGDLAPGDTVQVEGTPGEFPASGARQTQLGANPLIINCGISATASPVDVLLPLNALADLERYEGMLVRLPQQLVISEYFNYGRFGQYTLALPRPGEARLFQPTTVVEPGAAALALAEENLLRRITIDDGLSDQNPPRLAHPNGQPFSLANRFRGGDQVAGLQGILAQQFGTYRIQATGAGSYTAANPRPGSREGVGGTLRVGALNALNYFLTLDTTDDDDGPGPCGGNQNLDCRGADASQPNEFARQRAKLLAAIQLMDADVVGLIELENTPGVDPLADIVAGLNGAVGAGAYAAIDTGVIGTDAIKVGLIYRPARVTPVGDFALLTSAVDGRFLDTKSRPVLAQSFQEVASGERFTVALAHLKSKGSSCADVGDPDQNDGQGNCNGTRTSAAQALVDWLAGDPTGSGDPDYLIIGDLNSYALEDPIDAIIAGPDDATGTADDYSNLIARFQGAEAYSYVFDGQVGYLDHALANGALSTQVTGATELHINADEPSVLDYDTSFKPVEQEALYEPNAYRASDHDPLIVGLDLGADDPDDDPNPLPDPLPRKLYVPLAIR